MFTLTEEQPNHLASVMPTNLKKLLKKKITNYQCSESPIQGLKIVLDTWKNNFKRRMK